MGTKYKNYLSNLPLSTLLKKDYSNSLAKIIKLIITSDDNTSDLDLIDFRNQLIGIIINNIKDKGIDFILNDYFKLRSNLVMVREDIIKNNKDDLIELLGNEEYLVSYINKLDEIYRFNVRYERVKVDNKYEIVKKEIKLYDLPLYITEFEEKVNLVSCKIINYYNIDKLNNEEMERLFNILNTDEVVDKALEIYDKEFLVFKNCKLDIFEKLYLIYKKEVLEFLKYNLSYRIKNAYIKKEKMSNEIRRYKITKMNMTAIHTRKIL